MLSLCSANSHGIPVTSVGVYANTSLLERRSSQSFSLSIFGRLAAIVIVWSEWASLITTCSTFYTFGSFISVIMEYLVNISKRRAFWSLNEDILKITILTTNTPYPSRKIRRIRACTHQRPQRKEDQYAVLDIWHVNILEDIKRGPYSKKPQYVVSNPLDTPRHFKTLSLDELRSPDFNLLSDQEYSDEEVSETMAESMEQYMSKTQADYGSGVTRTKIEDKDNFELKGHFLKTATDAKVDIQEMAEYSQKWHNGTSRSRSTKTSDGLEAIQAQLNNLGREIKKVNEKVYAAQVGCE
ncbi:hypothetical protein Tco_0060545 [Tanacetum coccineum]